MEAVVFCGIAGLVAFCVAGLLPGDAVASRPCGFAAGGVNQILLLTGRIFDRAPGAVDVLASLAEPFRDMGAAKRLLFGSSGESGGAVLDKRRAAAMVVLLMGVGSVVGGVASLSVPGALIGAGVPVMVLAVAGGRAKKAMRVTRSARCPKPLGHYRLRWGPGIRWRRRCGT